ncbi:MAG: protease inhibitor I42 family protein [Candidatus Omnitrophota bacterium]
MAILRRDAKIAVTLVLFLTLGSFLSARLGCADKDVVSVKGTIRHFSYGEGFYGIKGDDGKEYKPLGLTSSFKIEGLKVKVRGRLIKKRFLFKPQCTPIEIIDIERASRDEVVGKRVYSNSSIPIEVKVSQNFIIKLESNQTTGYLWKLAAPVDKKILKCENVDYITGDETGIIIVGGGGEERWTFKATGPGETKVSFKYVRPWEKGVPPAKNLTFKINVIDFN